MGHLLGGGPLSRDGAVSDVVGTAVLLGVTVALAAAVAVSIAPSAETVAGEVPRLDVIAWGSPGASNVTLLRAAGPDLDRGDLRAVLNVGGAAVFDGRLGATGVPWRVGELVRLPVPAPLAAGARVEVRIVSAVLGKTLAETSLDLPTTTPPAPPPGFTATPSFPGVTTPAIVRLPGQATLIVTTSHPEGRASVQTVTANLAALLGSPQAPLRDDGAEGDVVAGDGVWTMVLTTPVAVAPGPYALAVAATDARGAIVRSSIDVVLETPPFYNTQLLERAGVRILKYGSGANSGKVSPVVKFRAVADPVRFPDEGIDWRPSKAQLAIDPFKHNANPLTDLTLLCTGESGKVRVFTAENATISWYDPSKDTLRFYFVITWQNVNRASETFTETIEANEGSQYFLLRVTDSAKVVTDGGWPSAWKSCP